MKRHSAINRILGAATWLALACLVLANAPVHAQEANKLEAVDVQTLPGQQLQLTLRLSGPAAEPLSFTIDNPARISFDLPGTALALPSRRIDVRSSGLDSIVAAEAKDRTRLVLNLDRLMPYQTRVEGNNIVVMLGTGQQGAAASAAAPESPSAASAAPSSSAGPACPACRRGRT
jgi:type IV pilus assembly protein PilQ